MRAGTASSVNRDHIVRLRIRWRDGTLKMTLEISTISKKASNNFSHLAQTAARERLGHF